MHFIPLAHGASGVLDEVLECGGLLLVVLLVYFFNATRKRSGDDSPDPDVEPVDEQPAP